MTAPSRILPRIPRPIAMVALAMLGVAAPSSVADNAAWWDRKCPWRRAVLVSAPSSDLPGQEAAWVEFLTHGACRPGGPSIRVTTSTGRPVKHFVMQTGPDDRARVCFELIGRANKYFIYYGNPEARAPEDDWRCQRGVLLEGWDYKGGSIANFRLTQETFIKAGDPVGRTFVPNVFLGHNPLGMPANYCHKYTGWLICPSSGRYGFATTSKDASFLLVDDKMVVEWAGRHGAIAQARYMGYIELVRGLHKLTYYHVSIGPDGRAVAAWQPPGSGKPVVIPASAFAPIAHGVCGDLDRYGPRTQPDFSVEGPFETFCRDHYTYRYTLQGTLGDQSTSNTKYEWDFGDGITAEGQKVGHVFLNTGMHTITLTAVQGHRRFDVRNRILVTRDWNRVVEPKLEPVTTHARIVANYAFADLSTEDLAAAISLLYEAKQAKACLDAVAALPTHVQQAKPEVVLKLVPEIYDVLVAAPISARPIGSAAGDAKLAVTVLEAIETKVNDVSVKAVAGSLAGRVLLEELGDLNRAETCFAQVVKQYGDRTRDPAIRRARIGLADVYLRTRRYRLAKETLERTASPGDPQKRNVAVGSYARAIDDFIRRREFEAAAENLDRWEWEYPGEKLRGYSTLLRAQLLSAQQSYDHLLRLIEGFPLVVVEGDKPTAPVDVVYLTIDPQKLDELYKIDPATGRIQSASGAAFPPNPYGMEMGLLAADAMVKLNQKDRARRALAVLIRLYPDSPQIEQARKRLKELGR